MSSIAASSVGQNHSLTPFLIKVEIQVLNRLSWIPALTCFLIPSWPIAWVRIGFGLAEIAGAVASLVYHLFLYCTKSEEYAQNGEKRLSKKCIYIMENYLMHGILNLIRGLFEKMPVICLLCPIYDGIDFQGKWEWIRNVVSPGSQRPLPLFPPTIGGMARAVYVNELPPPRTKALHFRL